jgi:hypothetical protein
MMIAITIAIENRSGETGDRFSSANRIAIFMSKSIRDFFSYFRSQFKPASGPTGRWYNNPRK